MLVHRSHFHMGVSLHEIKESLQRCCGLALQSPSPRKGDPTNKSLNTRLEDMFECQLGGGATERSCIYVSPSPKGGSEKGELAKTALVKSIVKSLNRDFFSASPFSDPPFGDGDSALRSDQQINSTSICVFHI